MSWVAWKMLVGDRTKYFGIVFGIAFAALLIAQQSAIFLGFMRNTVSQIRDLRGADLWVMDPHIRSVDDQLGMTESSLHRVRGVPGVAWAVPLYKGLGQVRLGDGKFENVILLGLDDATLVGAPRQLVAGSLAELRRPDAIIIDEAGFRHLWPGEPVTPGKTLEMNDRRAVVVGICKVNQPFFWNVVVYSRYSQAKQFVPPQRKLLSFVLAKAEPGQEPEDVCRRIRERTGLEALTEEAFAWKTIRYYLEQTGIPLNFGTTVLLGFLVGSAIAGQTFYTFTLENLRQFGALKAMGLGNRRIVGMVLLQALIVAVIGFGLGIGLAAVFGEIMTRQSAKLAFFMPWHVLAVTGLAVLLIAVLSSLLSVRRVLVLEPAMAFRS
jgi:putative ABC transport system permease protein